MADYLVTDTELTAVADAIREKGGTSAALTWPDGYVAAVGDISGGGGEAEYYLTFSSASPFTLAIANATKNWNGTLYYSTDKETWNEWNGTTTLSSGTGNKLYLCGLNNTVITGNVSSPYGSFVITGTGVSCTGNIQNLLDFKTVLLGSEPTMSDYAFSRLFNGCTSLTSAPSLPATTLAVDCYSRMFNGCTGLTTAPSLPATTLAINCYMSMFYGCTSLTTAPSLPATTLANNCYGSMFRSCTSLTSAPSLSATTLATYCCMRMFQDCTALNTLPSLRALVMAQGCYTNMFLNCSSIKIAETYSAENANSYRIPISGTGTDAIAALTSMFANTGGTFTGTPTINTTYYTSNTIVS